MTQLSDEQVIQEALRQHQSGRLDEAEALYRQVLARRPDHPDALHLLGLVAHHRGSHELAAQLIEAALRASPKVAALRSNYGEALRACGRVEQSIIEYQKAVELRPDWSVPYGNLGLAYASLGRVPEAMSALATATRLNPTDARSIERLAMLHVQTARADEATPLLRRLVMLRPNNSSAHVLLGNALHAQGQFAEAADAFRQALRVNPKDADAYYNLGNAVHCMDQIDEARECYEKAATLRPGFALALTNLGNVLKLQGKPSAAIARYRQAIESDPRCAPAHNNLATCLHALGMAKEALESIRTAGELAPHDVRISSNLLYYQYYTPGVCQQEILAEHRRWAQAYADPHTAHAPAHRNTPNPNRRLRVGYVSADFRAHAAAFFIEPILTAHDRQQVEITCYHEADRSDDVTQRLRRVSNRWRDVAGILDDDLASLIRQDEIDILVDLGVHSAYNRLLTFARKPAPVQITYLGYPGTTGIVAMDWRITDPHLEPTDDPAHGIERPLRLPETYFCMLPPVDAPGITPAPFTRKGHVTFGAFNRLEKTNADLIGTWSELLRRVPDSRLLMLSAGLDEPSTRDLILERFAADVRDRIEMRGQVELRDYLTAIASVDVALDSHPFNGGTTTCHALWMGVPVVSQFGKTAVSRMGLSILSRIDLPELAVAGGEQFVSIASELAADREGLSELRRDLRERMSGSPLTDSHRFTANLEDAYRRAWRTWCEAKLPDA
ncbi:MAG: tetratricopeptide repeat protein [Tepidisphaeraceae bacterium]